MSAQTATAPAATDLLEATVGLCRASGRPRPVALDPMTGGKNNRVFRVRLEDGGALVLKSYFHDPRDPRDRLRAEWEFLTYAWTRGVQDIPEPIARRSGQHLGLYGFVPGRRPTAPEVSAERIDAAADFLIAVNASPRRPADLAAASEACFTLGEHVETVERRLGRLGHLDPEPGDRGAVDAFVTGRLMPSWTKVRSHIESSAAGLGIASATPLDVAEQIVSPSDFGFHNALLDAEVGRMSFIDFEYGGRDDPAKLTCDFFCQPEVPVPMHHFPRFVERLAAGLGLGEAYRERCRLLLDLYRVKWATIILNQFMPLGATRRAFAAHQAGNGERQIARAEAQLTGIAA